MALDLYLAFVVAAVVLVLIPGPNVAVIVAASIGQGCRHGLVAVAGTSAAMGLQLALTVLGMTAAPADGAPGPKSARRLFWRGFLVSATNPKTLLFYGAFFPQFIDPAGDIAAQLIVLSLTFLAVAVILDSGWAMSAGYARRFFAGRGRLLNRLGGGVLIGAGLGLALARRG